MDIPRPPQAMTVLATFVRARLSEVTGTLSPLWRRDDVEVLPANRRSTDQAVKAAARQFATAVVGAAAPFAPTSYSRARLLRQMHASGLLTADELRRTTTIIDLDEASGTAGPTGAAGTGSAAAGSAGAGPATADDATRR